VLDETQGGCKRLETELAEHPLAQRFQDLGPHDVLAAIERAGFQCTGRLMALNSYENRVYQVDTNDGSGIVAKFYRPGRWSVETIEDEHDFLFELADAGVAVAQPHLIGGEYSLATLPIGDSGIHYALFPRIVGRVNDEPSETELRQLGREIAILHGVGQLQQATYRGDLSVDTWGEPALHAITESGLLPAHLTAAYTDVVQQLFECHHANLLWNEDGPIFLDFDDFLHGPAIQDVWMLAPSIDSGGQWRRTVLLQGYREVAPFDDEWIGLVEPLRALRIIRYAGWICRRWHDPTFQRTFAHVSADRFWADEVQNLREQMIRIERPEQA
jgi:Ser/Thr protein kinase RdoA (MazF antagonist)